MTGAVIHFNGNTDFPRGSPVLRDFVMDQADVRLVQGPVESGKTVGCIGAVYKAMCEMPRCKDGVRRSRWLISRPTYGELFTTVRADWVEWFPDAIYGPMSETEPYRQTMTFLDVEAEIIMMALADTTEKTMKKLRSMQLTGLWINECQYSERELVVAAVSRTGRFPKKIDCPDYTRRKWAVLDNNAPTTFDHWILMMRGDTPIPTDMPAADAMALQPPANWKFFVQPPAVFEKRDSSGNVIGYELNRKAENLQNMGKYPYLPDGVAYPPGMAQDEIDRDFRNLTRASKTGTARYPNFSRDMHVAKSELHAYEGAAIEIGVDPGGSPGFTMGQKVDGRWYILHAEEMANTEAVDLADHIKDILARRFPFYRETGIKLTGDPAGGWGGLNTKITTKQIFAAAGLPYDFPATKDRPDLRLSTGRNILNQLVRGQPKMVMCPVHCRQLIAAWDGGMQMKDGSLVKASLFANVGESAEYLLWGGGEAKELLTRPIGSRKAAIQTIPNHSSIFTPRKSWSSRPSRLN